MILKKKDVFSGTFQSLLGYLESDANIFWPRDISDQDTHDLSIKQGEVVVFKSAENKTRIRDFVRILAANPTYDGGELYWDVALSIPDSVTVGTTIAGKVTDKDATFPVTEIRFLLAIHNILYK